MPVTGNDKFAYWKRPWHKWIVLTAGVLQLVFLWMNIREYNGISSAGILSASAWADFAAWKHLQCSINGILAVLLMGFFAIGVSAGTQKKARLAESVLMLLSASGWIAAGAVLHMFSSDGKGLVFILIFLLTLAASAYSFCKYKKAA